MKKVMGLISTLGNLTKIPRTGGVYSGIEASMVESIAEHSFKVSYLSLIVGKMAIKNGIKVEMEKVLEAAVKHDWEDAVLFDVPSGSPSYRSYFEEDIRQIYKKATKKMLGKIDRDIGKEVGLELSEDSLGDNEKRVIEIADVTAMLWEILDWKFRGLRFEWFDYVWSNTLKRFKDKVANWQFLNDWGKEMDQLYERGVKPTNPFLTKEEFQTLRKE
jgi:5'-deoxynucleotidase YfbR-like HD superfamily hydrolase